MRSIIVISMKKIYKSCFMFLTFSVLVANTKICSEGLGAF